MLPHFATTQYCSLWIHSIEKGDFTENSKYDPNSPYAASKAGGDHIISSYCRTFNFPGIITNCSNNYGRNQFPEKLVPLLIIKAIENKDLPIYGNGKQIRDWLYVDDHVSALMRVALDGNVGETYNIGGNNEIQNIEVVKKICIILDEIVTKKINGVTSFIELITYVKDRPGHDLRYAIDSSKLKKKLKWKPKTSFKKGLEKTFLWYLENQKYYSKLNKKDITSRIGFKKWLKKE